MGISPGSVCMGQEDPDFGSYIDIDVSVIKAMDFVIVISCFKAQKLYFFRF